MIRKILSYTFKLLVAIFLNIKIKDTQTGLKAGRTNVLKQIFNIITIKRYAYDVELITIAKLLNYKIKELPITIQLNSYFNPIQIFLMFKDLLGVAYRLHITKWYQYNINREM